MAGKADRLAEFVELRSADQRLPAVCERIAFHYERGATVLVFAPGAADAQALDDLLWTFRQNAFIPHVRLERAEEPLIEPVVIFSDAPGDLDADVLLLLVSAEALPDWFSRFACLCDLAPVYDEKLREAARRRYAACREAGYHMKFVKP
jgi:DNA polymerase-3 subunit chi